MAHTITVKVSRHYQIVVLALAHQLLNIQSRDRLLVDIQDGMMVSIPHPDNNTETLTDLHQEIWQDVDVQKYIDKERDAWVGSAKD